jgi:hypothetical protein
MTCTCGAVVNQALEPAEGLGEVRTRAASSVVDFRTLQTLDRAVSRGPSGIVLIVARRVGTAHVMDAYCAGRRCLRAAAIIRTGDLS